MLQGTATRWQCMGGQTGKYLQSNEGNPFRSLAYVLECFWYQIIASTLVRFVIQKGLSQDFYDVRTTSVEIALGVAF